MKFLAWVLIACGIALLLGIGFNTGIMYELNKNKLAVENQRVRMCKWFAEKVRQAESTTDTSNIIKVGGVYYCRAAAIECPVRVTEIREDGYIVERLDGQGRGLYVGLLPSLFTPLQGNVIINPESVYIDKGMIKAGSRFVLNNGVWVVKEKKHTAEDLVELEMLIERLKKIQHGIDRNYEYLQKIMADTLRVIKSDGCYIDPPMRGKPCNTPFKEMNKGCNNDTEEYYDLNGNVIPYTPMHIDSLTVRKNTVETKAFWADPKYIDASAKEFNPNSGSPVRKE